MNEQQRPHFLIVCDHGIRGGQLDRVALLPWFPERPGWWAAKGVDEPAIRLWPMEGNRRGWDPKWLGPERLTASEPDPRREAIEIGCPVEACTTWAYRSDDKKLQTLLTKIATDPQFRAAVTVSADEKLIVMKLKAMHLARGYTQKHYHLQV
jgi:hypothetical protein